MASPPSTPGPYPAALAPHEPAPGLMLRLLPIAVFGSLCTRATRPLRLSPASRLSTTPAMEGRGVKLAAVQMRSVSDKAANLATCRRLVLQASANQATLVCLPECCLFIGGGLFADPAMKIKEPADGPSMVVFQELAREAGVWLSVGSFPEESAEHPDKGFNLQVLISPEGAIAGSYRKVHLFDSPYSGLFESNSTGTLVNCISLPFT